MITLLPNTTARSEDSSVLIKPNNPVVSNPFTRDWTFYDGLGYLGSNLCINPVRRVEQIIIRGGPHSQKTDAANAIYRFKSVDEGKSFAPKETVFEFADGVHGVHSVNAGYDPNGRLHMVYSKRLHITAPTGAGALVDLFYKYSDSDGDAGTWSAPISLLGLTTGNGLQSGYTATQQIQFINGKLMLVMYQHKDILDRTETERVLVQCSNWASASPTWTISLIEFTAGSVTRNEIAIAPLSDTHLIAVCRVFDAPYEYMTYTHSDNGDAATPWVNAGYTNVYIPDLTSNSGPPSIRSFLNKGERIVQLLQLSKSAYQNMHSIYAKAEDLIANPVAWNMATRTAEGNGITTGRSRHYGQLTSPIAFNGDGGNATCKYVCSHEFFPWTGDNTINYGTLDTSRWSSIEAVLGNS